LRGDLDFYIRLNTLVTNLKTWYFAHAKTTPAPTQPLKQNSGHSAPIQYQNTDKSNHKNTPNIKTNQKNNPPPTPENIEGGHTSTRETTSPQQKEPEKHTSPIRFQSKTQAIPRKPQAKSYPTKTSIPKKGGGGGGHASEPE